MYEYSIPVRLVGFRVEKLIEKDEQISMFNATSNDKDLDKTLDELRNKYGYNSIKKAGEVDIYMLH